MNAKTQLRQPDGTSLKVVSEPTLKRLPLYHRFLKEWQAAGHETVSCTDIGQDLDLDPTQVRKDLESVGAVGPPADWLCAGRFDGGAGAVSGLEQRQ